MLSFGYVPALTRRDEFERSLPQDILN